MKIENKTSRAFQHGRFLLGPGQVLDVPEDVAKIWIKIGAAIEYIAPAEKAALEEENAKLKAELANLKKAESAKTETKKSVARKK